MQTIFKEHQVKTLINGGIETEIAIELVKTTFSQALMRNLSLLKVTSPIIVEDNTGINDDLNGIERSVSFPIADMQTVRGVVVQSLAKWKRLRLKQLGVDAGKGIITDMKAIRPDEILSPIHSIYVDQWDWEKVMLKEERNINFLKDTVLKIYEALLSTEKVICDNYPQIQSVLPTKIKFIHSQELLDKYPFISPKERENRVAKDFGAVFIIGIGSTLSNNEPHDGRAPDYDDWSSEGEDGLPGLNGDIIVWNPVSQSALELSSMGIRVNEESLSRQLTIRGCQDRSELMFHSSLLRGDLPQSIGGGIGQSRVCMFMLRKHHIGEVQAGIWPNHIRMFYHELGIEII
jgi:aspartate--ammonia ligase